MCNLGSQSIGTFGSPSIGTFGSPSKCVILILHLSVLLVLLQKDNLNSPSIDTLALLQKNNLNSPSIGTFSSPSKR